MLGADVAYRKTLVPTVGRLMCGIDVRCGQTCQKCGFIQTKAVFWVFQQLKRGCGQKDKKNRMIGNHPHENRTPVDHATGERFSHRAKPNVSKRVSVIGKYFYSIDFYTGRVGTIGTGLSFKTFDFHPIITMIVDSEQ